MSRTHRNQFHQKYNLRKPKTSQERKQIQSILENLDDVDYTISGINHLQHRLSKLPHANDDVVISAYYEGDYNLT
jgi:helix-turn-helix protein